MDAYDHLRTYAKMVLPITLEFSGGAELLFAGIKKHEIKLPDSHSCWLAVINSLTPAPCPPTAETEPFDSRYTIFRQEAGEKGNVKSLLSWIHDNLLKERPEFFMQGDTVRPGILVLVNDTDWELVGELEYEIQPNDRIVFISTLHGG